ncbi:alpha-hydroxy acid oxidase [Streptomyces sp. NPDC054796]
MTRLERRLPRPKDLAPLLRLRAREPDAVRRRLAHAHTIGDLRRIVRRRTPAGPFHYTDGAADSEGGLRRAREAFADLEFRPSVLRNVAEADLSTAVLGARSALPFGMAPTGFTRMMHAAGERAVVASAARAGIPYALSTMGTTSIGDVAAAAPSARKWFQLYLWKDRELSLRLVADAKAAGYEALLVTVDVPVGGNRLRDLRLGMTIPPQLTLKTFLDASYRWEWWFNFLTTEPLSFAFDKEGEGALSEIVAKLYDPTVTFEDLSWIREAWDGPLIVKGVQTVRDAERALEHGADGIVVSHHGGRQLDRAPVPLHLLPEIVGAVGARGTVMLDSGITNGGDIVAALALGADFTLVGRAYLYGLMAGGEAGVDRCVEILAAEIERTMKLLGVTSVAELCPDHVRLMSRRAPVPRSG